MSAPIISGVMMMYSGLQAVQGLSEGNISKAVLGAVGAYVGFSGLSGLGTEAAGAAAAEEAAGTAAADGATAAATDALGTGAAGGADTLGTAASIPAGEAVAAKGLGTNAAAGAVAEDPGFLESVGQAWGGMGDKTRAGLIQLGGGMLQGSAQEDLLKEKWDRDKKLADEERKRRGYSAGSGILGKYTYNPRTGQMEVVNA